MRAAPRIPPMPQPPRQQSTVGIGEELANLFGAGQAHALFTGPKAKTWDAAAAQRAAEMERAGSDPRTIWRDTGTFRDFGGNWRQEIDDSGASLTGVRKGGLFEVINHPAARAAYPDLERVTVRRTGLLEPYYALGVMGRLRPKPDGRHEMTSYEDAANALIANLDQIQAPLAANASPRSVILHEMQHAATVAEGFPSGTNPTAAGSAQAYLRNDDERLARLVQRRQFMTPERRREVYPLDSPSWPFVQPTPPSQRKALPKIPPMPPPR